MAGRKILVITGGLGALGRVVVNEAVQRGAEVIVVDSSVAVSRGPTYTLGGIDLTNVEATESAFRAIGSNFGKLGALINLAGGFAWERTADGTAQAWENMYRINVMTALNSTKSALPYLDSQTGASVVNVGAASANKATEGMGPYAGAKSALHRLTECLAEELKPNNVRVNAVLPSIIDTPTNRDAMPQADFSKWVSPADLASVILFLASSESRAINGALLPVLGGM